MRLTGINSVLAPLVALTVTVPEPLDLPAAVVHWKEHEPVWLPVQVLFWMKP